MIEYNNNGPIIILGVTFDGVNDIIAHARSGEPKEGVWVGEDSQLYPCFDSSDSLYENRRYWNFVFARSEEEKDKNVERLGIIKPNGNYNKLTELLHPMAYWQGDTIYPLVVTEEGNEFVTDYIDEYKFDDANECQLKGMEVIDPNDELTESEKAEREWKDGLFTYEMNEFDEPYWQLARALKRLIDIDIIHKSLSDYYNDADRETGFLDYPFFGKTGLKTTIFDKKFYITLSVESYYELDNGAFRPQYEKDGYSFAYLEISDDCFLSTSSTILAEPISLKAFFGRKDFVAWLREIIWHSFECIIR